METNEHRQSRPLSTVESGKRVRLVRVNAGWGLRGRLAAMGLLPGAELRVVSNSAWGPFIVAVKDGRMILGRGMAEKIEVE